MASCEVPSLVLGEKQSRSSGQAPRLCVATAPLLAAAVLSTHGQKETDDTEDSGSIFTTVKCSSQPPNDRLGAIKSLNVVADVVEEISETVVSITTTG